MQWQYVVALVISVAGLNAALVARPADFKRVAPVTPPSPAAQILQRYASAWRGKDEVDLQAPLVVSVAVAGDQGGEFWVRLSNAPGAAVHETRADAFDIRFELDLDLLQRLDRGSINALTAMGQAKASDPVPLTPRLSASFSARPDAALLFRRIAFHFWNRGWPEVTPFDGSAARRVHGGNAVVLAYDDRFRSAWYQLKTGMHINAEPTEQRNDFPQLVVVTRGSLTARLGGAVSTLSEGQSVLIPSGMAHEFWAGPGQYGEFLFVAFGNGA